MSVIDTIHPQASNQATYQSRWGFHPLGYDDFVLLRALARRWFKADRMAAAWGRWYRKRPHNRIQYRTLKDELGRKCGREVVGPMPEPATDPLYGELLALPLAEAYFQARHPKTNPQDVTPLRISTTKIRALATKAGVGGTV